MTKSSSTLSWNEWIMVTYGGLDNSMKGSWPRSRSHRLLHCAGRNKKGTPGRKNGIEVADLCWFQSKQKPGRWGEALLWVERPWPSWKWGFLSNAGWFNQCVSSVCVPNSQCVISGSTWNAFIRCTRLHNHTFANSRIMMGCVKCALM